MAQGLHMPAFSEGKLPVFIIKKLIALERLVQKQEWWT